VTSFGLDPAVGAGIAVLTKFSADPRQAVYGRIHAAVVGDGLGERADREGEVRAARSEE
jgi:hypothetical protein